MNSLKRIDILFFTYLIITTIILLFSWDQSGNSLQLITIRGVIVLGVAGLIYLDTKKNNSLIRMFRLTYPLIFSGYFYAETVYFNKLLLVNIDPYLVDIESGIFGTQPSIEFSAFFENRIFTEFMYMGYFSFYLIILGFTLYVYFKRKKYASQLIFMLSASLYIFYLIFSLIPSAGPQFYFSSPGNILPDGYLFEQIMHFIQKTAEQPTGAFPSSHVGISVIILLLSKKYAPVFFSIAWPIVIILILSTVYIKAHYVIDVIGGIVIAPFILYLSHFLYHLPAPKKLRYYF